MRVLYSFLCNKAIDLTVLLWFSTAIMGVCHGAIPLTTDDTDTQGRGRFQAEILGECIQDKEGGIENKTNKITASLTYGIVDSVDIVLSAPHQSWCVDGKGFRQTEKGISDLGLEVKWRFFEKEALAFALKPGVTLPTGNARKGLGAGKAAYYLNLIASKELDPWSFDANAAYIRNENGVDERENLWSLSVAAKLEIRRGLKLASETGIESNHDRSSAVSPVWTCGGFIYSPLDNFDICFGVKAGITRPAPDISFRGGMTVRF